MIILVRLQFETVNLALHHRQSHTMLFVHIDHAFIECENLYLCKCGVHIIWSYL